MSREPTGLRSRSFLLLIIATIGGFSGYTLLLPIVPLWAERGGSGAFGAGATTAVYMLATVLTQLAMPWLLDRGGYRWTMPAGALLLGLPSPLFLLTADLGALLAISGLRGVGFGMLSVVGSALAARLVGPGQLGRAAGYYGLAVGVPGLITLPLGVGIALTFGFAATFWIAAAGPVLCALAALGIGAGATGARGGKEGTGARTRGPRLWRALAAPTVVMVVLAVASSGIVTFLAIPLSGSPPVATAALLGYGTAAVAARWSAGLLSDRRGRITLLTPCTVAAAAGMALLSYPLWAAENGTLSPGTAGAAAVIGGATLFGVGFGGVQNDTIVFMFHRAGSAGYGTASAAWNLGFDSGTGIGAVALGAMAAVLGYGPGFLAAAVAVLGCLPLAAILARRDAPDSRTPIRADGRSGSR